MICETCGRELQIGDWPYCRGSQESHGAVFNGPTAAHPSERAVVWKHPVTGQVRYPGRNDVPMPKRYAEQGFERHEMPTLRDVHRLEKQKGVLNEKAWFDRNGKGFDE